MNVLFAHQNIPAQFRHLVSALAADPGNRVAFITRREEVTIPGVQIARYQTGWTAKPDAHPYLASMEPAVVGGQGAAAAAVALKREGFRPDIMVAHPGWGEALFLKDVFPEAPLLVYCEFYYRAFGQDVHFDPAEPVVLERICRVRMQSGHLLLALEAADRGLSPTQWQKSTHPAAFQPKIEVIFDGIDTDRASPDAGAGVQLQDGTVLRAGDPVVTYVARNLEPHRGFPTFIRSLPAILERRPDVRVLVIGGDEVSYSSKPKGHASWREALLSEVEVDPSRVFFLGRLPYAQYLRVLQVSAVHVYLTFPFVVSWSLLEALSAGCFVIASDTAPVREVITHGENGWLVDFFRPDQFAARVLEALAAPEALRPMRVRARDSMVDRYALSHCLPRQVRLLEETAGRR